jgi:3-oxoacid CoA-transferase subunit A
MTAGRHANKVVGSIGEALASLQDGMTIMVGGFGLSGNPEALIKGVVERGAKHLTLVSNNAGNLGKGLAQWLRHGLIDKVICSYIGSNDDLHTRMASGEVKVEVTPQGTLAERMRAAGAGIPAFYTPTGVGTVVAEGKEVARARRSALHDRESAARPTIALMRARKVSDRFGNLPVLPHRAQLQRRSWRPPPAVDASSRPTSYVDVGAIDPDDVHLPGHLTSTSIVARARARGSRSSTRPRRKRPALAKGA